MYRYPGIQPFTQDQQKIFMGRNAEIKELLGLLKIYPLTVLFAKSGIGKSSLIQAGVQPKLNENNIIPVFIRLNLEELSPEEQFFNHLVEQGFLNKNTPKELSLWEILKKARFVKHGRYFTPLLIFDQFEELFTSYSTEQRANFVKQFADLANGTIPKSYRDDIQKRKDKIHPKQYEKLLEPLNIKILLALRSDMLHYLEGLTDFIPGIFRVLYELQPLNEDNAKEAIMLPAAVDDNQYSTAPFSYSNAAITEIISFLQKKTVDKNLPKNESHSTIECSNLQVVCQHIEKLVAAERKAGNNINEVTPNFYEGYQGLEKIIDDFYQRTIEQFPEERRKSIRNAIERGLMKNERRLSMEKAYLIDQYGITEAELKDLVNDRLLRKEPRMGSDYYEISHDTLIAPINRSFLIRKEREDRLKEAKEERERAAQAAEKNKRRYRRVVTTLGFVGMAMAVLAITFAIRSAIKSEQLQKEQKKVLERNKQLMKQKDVLEASTEALKKTRKLAEIRADSAEALRHLSDSLLVAIKIEGNIAKATAYMANGGYDIAHTVLGKTIPKDRRKDYVSESQRKRIQIMLNECERKK